jgi:hypothetical protein
MMEHPERSKSGRTFQTVVILTVMVSVLMFYTETLPSFTAYGEGTKICGLVLSHYCENKNNITDPGCYSHKYVNNKWITTGNLLKFSCNDGDDTDDECFAKGYNFGSTTTNLTCSQEKPYYITPFESSTELARNFRKPDFIVNRDQMHRISDICGRLECQYDSNPIIDGNTIWKPMEILTNLIFSFEIIMRFFVTYSTKKFLCDVMNLVDILSVVPFFSDIFSGARYGDLNFSIVASSPQPILLVTLKSLKVFRIFKTTRHFSASKIIYDTARTAWKQIFGIISLLVFIVIVFAIMLFEVEQGQECFYGINCPSTLGDEEGYKIGQRILVDKNGDITQFANVLDGLWFCMVTLTTTGYGDKVPVTNLGQVFAIFLMLFGIVYMAMPLTATSSSFWRAHTFRKIEKEMKEQRSLVEQKKKPNFMITEHSRIQMIELEEAVDEIMKRLCVFLDDIQTPSSNVNSGGLTMLERCAQIESDLRNCLEHYDSELYKLCEVYSSSITRKQIEEIS